MSCISSRKTEIWQCYVELRLPNNPVTTLVVDASQKLNHKIRLSSHDNVTSSVTIACSYIVEQEESGTFEAVRTQQGKYICDY